MIISRMIVASEYDLIKRRSLKDESERLVENFEIPVIAGWIVLP